MTSSVVIHGQVAGQPSQHVTAPFKVDDQGGGLLTTAAGVVLGGAVETADGTFPVGTQSVLVHVLVGTVTIEGRVIAAGDPDWGFFLPPLKTAVPYTISSGGSAHIFVAT